MGHLEQLSETDAWLALLAEIDGLPPPHQSAFGRAGQRSQRRLGLRLPASCWALLSCDASSTYAMAVELSATGVVLKLAGRDHGGLLAPDQRFKLDLFVPRASSPVRTVVRHVRALGDRHAFELVQITAADRLTLAEHLDHLMANPARRTALEPKRWSPS